MRRPTLVAGAGLGAASGVGVVALQRLGMAALGLPIAAFELFEAMTRWLPGRLVTAGIEALVAVITGLGVGPTAAAAKLAEKAMAVATFVVVSAVLGALAAFALRRVPVRVVATLFGAVWLVVVLLAEIATRAATVTGTVWNAAVFFGWGFLLVRWIEGAAPTDEETTAERIARRRSLGKLVAGLVMGTGALLGLSALFRRNKAGTPLGREQGVASPMPDRPMAVSGTRPEVTSNDRFYRIDIDLEPPRIDASTWRLRVEGLVEKPLELTIEQIRTMQSVTVPITLECISNPLGGDLISTSRWTGVPLREVLRLAGLGERARTIVIDAADGFYESVTRAEADDPRVMLVHAMNGVPLPPEHGFPLRIYIPDRHGMKQPKWITRMRAIDGEPRGYWPERGWSQEAIVKTTSVIDAVDRSSVGGVAFAGARGISKVEVQVDDGPWTQATILGPPLGPLTWVLWRYEWPSSPGNHTFRVRAYDGTGALQPTTPRGPHPDGASGIHSVTKRI